MGFRNPILGGGGALVRPAIKSPNYVPGTSGWTINRAGNAEFNDLVLRGMFSGNDYVVSEAGIFFYSGAPAAGNMTGSWAAEDGTDPYGNVYEAGLTLYSDVGSIFLGGLDGRFLSVGSSGDFINVEDGQVSFQRTVSQSSAIITQDYLSDASLSLTSGSNTPFGVQLALDLHASTATPTPGEQDTNPRLAVSALTGSAPAHLYVSGALVKSDNNSVGEVWHTVGATGEPAYASTNWAAGSLASSRYAKLQFRDDGCDRVHVCGTVHATTALAAGSYTLFVLSAGHRPQELYGDSAIQVSSGDVWKSGVRINVDSTGSVGINTPVAIAAGDGFYINALVPLGNLS